MKRQLALAFCLPLIIWLWRRDRRVRPEFSWTIWLPILWMLVLASHPASWWLGVSGSGGDALDGNSFDRSLYLVQIGIAIYILSRRGLRWSQLIPRNKGLALFYFFLLITVLWSAYPFVTFKRWFKDIAAVFIILVILTEQDPMEAIKAVFARCAFILFPLSVIFIKYVPEIGRQYSHHSGGATYSGITQQKNSLGEICIIFGLLLISELVQVNRPKRARWLAGHHFTVGFVLAIGIWLLITSNSKTSLICFLIGVVIVLSHKLPLLKGHPRNVVIIVLIAVPSFYIADGLFNISDQFLTMIGRDATLTERTDIWKAVQENPADPIIGAGYMMYWDLHRRIKVGKYEMDQLVTAHSGYIDTYLDGGAIGVTLLSVMLIATGFRATREFLKGSEYGRLVFAFFAVLVIYNVSESIYARRSPLWFTFLLFALEFRPALSPARKPIAEPQRVPQPALQAASP